MSDRSKTSQTLGGVFSLTEAEKAELQRRNEQVEPAGPAFPYGEPDLPPYEPAPPSTRARAEVRSRSMRTLEGTPSSRPLPRLTVRPFLVADQPRSTALKASNTWAANLPGLPRHPGHFAGWLLGEYWTDVGLSLHSAVAALARTSYLLLEYEAPAELLEECTAAQARRIQMARRAFQLASFFASAEVGPGPLDTPNYCQRPTRATMLQNIVHEGCVAETLTAVEAEQAASACEDPELAEFYQSLGEDAACTATHSFKVLRWLVQGTPELAGLAHRELSAIRLALPQYPEDDTEHPHFGLLSWSEKSRLRGFALTRIIRPLILDIEASVGHPFRLR